MPEEQFLANAINILITLVQANKPRNKEEFLRIVEQAVPFLEQHIVHRKLTNEEKEYIFQQTSDDYEYDIDVSTVEDKKNFKHWFYNRQEKKRMLDIPLPHNELYLKYLSEVKGWMTSSIKYLDYVSDIVVDFLGNPRDTGAWQRHGLLVGDVQAGKTANYTSVINKATDVGYQVIIVLAGTTENLRSQTQKRLNNEFVGSPKNEEYPEGIGDYYPNLTISRLFNQLPYKPISQTTAESDFMDTSSFEIPKENGVVLFVVKKNVSILTKLVSWFKKNNTTSDDDKFNASLLLIDDEADNASVDTNKPEMKTTAINGNIRDLLSCFRRSSYLAVTATPFANIFIDPELSKNGKPDLFPSDYICLIDSPKFYCGPDAMFSEGGRYTKNLIKISPSEMESSYPFGHKKNSVTIHSFEDLPTSMKRAIRYFLLAQGIMDTLPGTKKHRSMMINVTRFVDLQNNLARIIHEWLENELKQDVRLFSGLPDEAEHSYTHEYYELKKIWDDFKLGNIAKMSWSEYSTKHLLSSIDEVHVVKVNNSKQYREYGDLDYSNHKEGYRVIAVGGICLSRGLTLEGLVVSYFYRNSKAYDTLLQMCRWFGYRESYENLFRVWLASDAVDWYGLITEAVNDLKDQIRFMNLNDLTPNMFGLMVKGNPYTPLIVTAQGKMRHTVRSQNTPTFITQKLIETPRLLDSEEDNASNTSLINRFISSLGHPTICDAQSQIYWRNVRRDVVANLVENFRSGDMGYGFPLSRMSEYVRKSSPENWTVAIACTQKGEGPYPLELATGVVKIRFAKRTTEEVGGILKIGKHHVRVGNGPVTRLGLTPEEIKQYEKQIDKGKKNTAPPYLDLCNGVPRQPLLILYPLVLRVIREVLLPDGTVKEDEIREGWFLNKRMWAIGLGFAKTRKDVAEEKTLQMYDYVMNSVKLKDYHPEDEDDDEDYEY